MDKIEITFRMFELILILLGLLLVIFGWIVPYRQSVKEEHKRRKFEEDLLRRQWEKELIDKQISEFYGPIASLLTEENIRFSLILYQLGRKHIFEENKYSLSDLSEEDQRTWVHFVDTYIA